MYFRVVNPSMKKIQNKKKNILSLYSLKNAAFRKALWNEEFCLIK